MTQRIYTDRSRTETEQHCARQRWLEYHAPNGTPVGGLRPSRVSLPLAVGHCVHTGLERLTSGGQALWDEGTFDIGLSTLEENAVRLALADFQQYTRVGIELDQQESSALAQVSHPDYVKQLAASLGGSPEELGLETLMQRAQASVGEFERYLAAEQAALVEAMVRAYARRRLRPLLEQYEVLEVEREGQWQLGHVRCDNCGGTGSVAIMVRSSASDYEADEAICESCQGSGENELWFMSRPDALLRERASNQLYILSFKTTGAWDIRKERDAQHDMQGLSEGVEVERRLGEWWHEVNHPEKSDRLANLPTPLLIPPRMWEWLKTLPATPRILAIRYEYLLKGERWKDKDLTARLGVEVRSQRSPLIRQYVATSTPKRGAADYAVGDVCWSWDYIKDTGESGSLAWQNWHSQPVWEDISVKAWIDALDQSEQAMSGYDSTVGMEPRPLGWKSAAQHLGYTPQHPLDSVFVPPIVVYRNDDELRDWVEQVASQEQRVAEAAAVVAAASDEGERRSLLNRHFPMTRRACEYPSTCAFVKLCFGGEDIRREPVASGVYRAREANHPQEAVKEEA